MHPPAEAAVGSGDHVFAADEIGKGEDAIGHQLGVFDDVGGVAHHARDEGLPRRQLDVPPDFLFVLMTHVAGFDQVRLGIDTEHDIDDVAQRKIGSVRTMPTAPADVITHAIDGDAFEGVI
jgi:hypothetical protein